MSDLILQFGDLVPKKKKAAIEEDVESTKSAGASLPTAIVVRGQSTARSAQSASTVDIHIPGKIPPRPKGEFYTCIVHHRVTLHHPCMFRTENRQLLKLFSAFTYMYHALTLVAV